jgi:hypothetical protein
MTDVAAAIAARQAKKKSRERACGGERKNWLDLVALSPSIFVFFQKRGRAVCTV